MKKVCVCLVILFIFLLVFPAYSSQTGIDKRAIYNDALAYIELEDDYEKALELFEKLGSYTDSPNWRLYCMGMIAIRKANELEAQGFIQEAKEEIEQAISYFEFLSPIDFNGKSRNLYTYCNARLDEYGSKGISQSALDKYATLVGTEDSLDRYLRLIKGEPLPTQAPHNVTLSVVPARAESSVETLLGPGKKYMRLEIIQVDQYTKINICGKESDYYLIEVQKGNEIFRCWALTRKIQLDSSAEIPRVGMNGWKSTLGKSVQAYYGPGEQYAKTDFIIKQGTVVTAYESEGLYTMTEYSPDSSRKPARVWVKTDALSK